MVPNRIRFGHFELLPAERQLLDDGCALAIGTRAFDLLLALIERRDRVVTKAELLDEVWPGLVVEEANLPVQVSGLRKLLGPQAIATIPGLGYRFSMSLLGTDPTPRQDATAPALPPRRTNVPDAIQPLVGRDDDLAALSELISQHGLITLVGPSGVGKSRLAQWLLHSRRRVYEHGVCWVDLSALTDPDLVVGCISTALGLNSAAGEPLKTLLIAVQPLQMLVALDNAEHLVGAVSQLAQAVHDTAPGVRLIVTSQVPLNLSVETVYRLNTLAVPESTTPIDEALRYGAVALFAQRAKAANTRFVLTAGNIALAVEVCRRLDGLPLAIELAAARAPFLGLPALLAVLDERFRALTGGRRGAPERHQTLWAAMEWSHSLLSDTEQTVLQRLGVFANTFSLASAQQIVADSQLDAWSVLDALGGLVDRSLVAIERLDPVRYRLLETTRAFAIERLREAGEAEELHRRHALACRVLFEDAYVECFEGRVAVDHWRAALMPDLDSGRAACAWALNHDAETAVSLAASLALVVSNERPQDRRRLLESTRPLVTDALPAPLRARWNLEAAFDWGASQPALARRHAMHAVRLFRDLGDPVGLYRALSILVYCEVAEPDDEQHAEINELGSIEDSHWPAVVRAQGAAAVACWFSARGKFEAAIEWRHRAFSLYDQAGWSWQLLVAQANLMDSLLAHGRVDEAIACGVALQAQLHETRQLAALPAARLNLTAALLSKNETTQARQLAVEGWSQALQMAWQPYWADYLALLAAIEGRPRSASRLLGYANACYAGNGSSREINEARATQRVEQLAANHLGPFAFKQLVAAGAGLRDDEIAKLAFGVLDALDDSASPH